MLKVEIVIVCEEPSKEGVAIEDVDSAMDIWVGMEFDRLRVDSKESSGTDSGVNVAGGVREIIGVVGVGGRFLSTEPSVRSFGE